MSRFITIPVFAISEPKPSNDAYLESLGISSSKPEEPKPFLHTVYLNVDAITYYYPSGSNKSEDGIVVVGLGSEEFHTPLSKEEVEYLIHGEI